MVIKNIINANDIKSIKFIDNGELLNFDVYSISYTKDGIILTVRNENGERYNVNFSDEDKVEIIFELK